MSVGLQTATKVCALILQEFEVKAGPSGHHFLLWHEMDEEVLLDVQGFIGEALLPPLPKCIKCVMTQP